MRFNPDGTSDPLFDGFAQVPELSLSPSQEVVTFLAWAVTTLETFLILNQGTFAVILLFAWYINRGLVRHTVEDSFTRHVVLEYVAFAAVLIYLFVSSYQPRI